ncbi:MAG: hypothetical protein WAV13_06980 [Thermodesulfovibrionales bacterium]
MSDNKQYSLLAVLHEINRRELKNKLNLFPEDLRYYATVASGIVGAENAKRIRETPAGVSENSEEFVSKLLELTSFEDIDSFREVLGKYLIETLKDELQFCCLNCTFFDRCLDMENLSVGELFLRRVNGEETAEIRQDIFREIENALRNTPHVATDEAHRLCRDFLHHYDVSNVGEVFGRYSNIALSLQKQFGLDYKKFLQQMVSVNMTFFEKSSEKKVRADTKF